MKGILWVAALGMVTWGALWAQDGRELEFKVLAVQGSAEFKPLGKDARWQPLKEQMVLKRGTAVQTGLKSKVLLQFGESTKILVKSSTLVTLTEGWAKQNQVSGKLHVELGGVRVDVNEKRREELDFKVSTPEATASIRGTGFGIDSWSDLGTYARQYYGSVTFHNEAGVSVVLDDDLTSAFSQMIADMIAHLEHTLEMMMAMENAADQDSYVVEQTAQTQTVNQDSGSHVVDPGAMSVVGPIALDPVTTGSWCEFRRGDLVDSYLEHRFLGVPMSWTDDQFIVHQTAGSIFDVVPTGPYETLFNFGGATIWKLFRVSFNGGSSPTTQWRLERVGTGSGFEFQRNNPATWGSWSPYPAPIGS